MKKSIFTVSISFSESDLESILELLNEKEIDEEENEVKLTVEEVVQNNKLLEYLFSSDYVKYSGQDNVEYWNNDGWSDFKEYR